MRATRFFLENEFDQPIDRLTPTSAETPYFRCVLLECLDDGEFVASVDPPLRVAGDTFDRLVMSSRNVGEPTCVQTESGLALDFGDYESAAVMVGPGVDLPTFRSRLGYITLVPEEVVLRGGYWAWFRDAMGAFVQREGHSDVPRDHVEDGLDLGAHVEGVRDAYRVRSLDSDQVAYLESQPGWRW